MRIRPTVAALLLAACCAETVLGKQWLYNRQDTTADSSPSTVQDSASTSTPTATSDSPSSTADQSDSASTDTAQSSDGDSSATTTGDSSPTSTRNTGIDAATSAITVSESGSPTSDSSSQPTETKHASNQLPLQPKITPALGLAGVCLIIGGIALALVGIKHDWLHVFLSTALLASLSVSVLIIYIENPPVSEAVQGAYFVAACLTGLILGGISLIFKEITEGLGCLLGGFALGMWFLVLSPGGLIHSTTGKAILIAAFCIGCLALSFSHYTRGYGLIFCTSFAGAMAAIIGVDCFSRAGLKEFWVFLWDLNDDIFPLDTTTYPITRGIRVEIACTVILFLFGILSQFKIWKVVKERRLKQDAERLRDDESRDQLESRVGRDIEAQANRDRQEWEAAYGDKDNVRVNTDSGVGSSVDSFNKGAVSVTEREVGGLELAEMPGTSSKRNSKVDLRSTVMVRVASDDDPSGAVEASQEHLLNPNRHSGTTSTHGSQPSLHEKRSQSSMRSHENPVPGESSRTTYQQGPAVVPLPFSAPIEEEDVNADSRSVSSKGTAGVLLDKPSQRLTKLALQRTEEQNGGGTNLLAIDDDRASSIAATAAPGDHDDDWYSQHRLSAMPSANDLQGSRDSLMLPLNDEGRRSKVSLRSAGENAVDEDDDEALAKPPAEDSEPDEAITSKAAKRVSIARSARSGRGRGTQEEGAGDLTDVLDQKLSKVATVYRTNEWAKHIADADTPDPDNESGSHSPGIQVDTAFAQEAAKPVDIKELSVNTPVDNSVANTVTKNAHRMSGSFSGPPVRQPTGNSTTIYPMDRSHSSASGSMPKVITRTASGPLAAIPLVESPTEEEVPLGKRGTVGILDENANASTPNLMDQRNTMLKRKPTTQSFMGLSAAQTPNLINVIAPSDSASSRNVALSDEPESEKSKDLVDEEEEMTLAQRKELMQQRAAAEQQRQTMQSPTFRQMSASRQNSYPAHVSVSRSNSVQAQGITGAGGVIYDSHQPKRLGTHDPVKQNAMMTHWRSTLQQDANVKQPQLAEETARQQMLSERRQVEWHQQRQAQERSNRESMMDIAMRTGQLHNAHQDAMRRMQAKANKNG